MKRHIVPCSNKERHKKAFTSVVNLHFSCAFSAEFQAKRMTINFMQLVYNTLQSAIRFIKFYFRHFQGIRKCFIDAMKQLLNKGGKVCFHYWLLKEVSCMRS